MYQKILVSEDKDRYIRQDINIYNQSGHNWDKIHAVFPASRCKRVHSLEYISLANLRHAYKIIL